MRKLLNNKGSGYIMTAAIVLIVSMLIAVMLAYWSMMTLISRARDDTERVLDSFCIEKAMGIHDSLVNGKKNMVSGVYTDEFLGKLAAELGLEEAGVRSFAHKDSDDNTIFRYTNPLVGNIENDTLTLTMESTIEIPVMFAGKTITNMQIPLKVRSVYVLTG